MRPHAPRTLALTALIALSVPLVASAERVGVGAVVRVVHHCETPPANALFNPATCRKSKGTIAAVTADTLHLDDPAAAIPRDAIQRLEAQGSAPRRGRNAAIGALCGGLVAAAISVPATLNCSDGPCGLAIIVLVPVGIVGGAIVGSLVGSNRWREVPLDSLRTAE